jgi:hypothetical protein
VFCISAYFSKFLCRLSVILNQHRTHLNLELFSSTEETHVSGTFLLFSFVIINSNNTILISSF